MPRKTRSDARMPKLTKERREVVLGWLDDENRAIKDVAEMIADTFGVKISKSSLSEWYSSYLLSAEVRAAATLAGNLREELQSLPINLDDEFVSRATQAKFEAEVAKRGDLEGHVELRKLRQKDQAQKLAERTLEAAEQGFRSKFEQKEREIALSREKFEHSKLEVKKQIASLQKNLQAPDAPLRMARLVEAIDAL